MSVEAISWALNLAPVPADRGGQPSSACKFVSSAWPTMPGRTGWALRVTTSVSGKTALLIAADPYSQSGKAEHARQLGVRMVTEQVFCYRLDQMQATAGSASPIPEQRPVGSAREPGVGVS